jgi:hypothetical protein
MLLVALGAYLLMREIALFDIPSLGDVWPVILIVIGLARLVRPQRSGDIQCGLFFTLLGLWFLAVELNWRGLDWRTSWPLILVIWGFVSIVGALLDRNARARAGGEA